MPVLFIWAAGRHLCIQLGSLNTRAVLTRVVPWEVRCRGVGPTPDKEQAMAWSRNTTPPRANTSDGGFRRLGKDKAPDVKTGEILSVKPQELVDAISVVIASGCGFMLSPTQDGGALSLILYAGDQRHRGYASNAEEFRDLLFAARDVAEAHMVGGPAKRVNGPLQAR